MQCICTVCVVDHIKNMVQIHMVMMAEQYCSCDHVTTF